ncbi:MAG: FHA domain-containing protein, partial [Candidatus Binatia bacterium]
EYCDACGAKLPASTATAAEPASTPTAPDTEAPVVTGAAASTDPGSSTEAEAPQEEAAPVSVSAPTAPAPQESVPVTAPVQNAKLTVMRGGTVGKVFPLQAGDNMVGRWDPDSGAFPEVDLEADDIEARISRKHALIRVSDKITIEDIGSLNGTFVNRGTRLEPGSLVPLKDGDEIIIGKTFFKVSLA